MLLSLCCVDTNIILFMLTWSPNLVYVMSLKPLDDEKKVTSTILDALRETGQRGIISRGWGALGSCKLPGLVF